MENFSQCKDFSLSLTFIGFVFFKICTVLNDLLKIIFAAHSGIHLLH